MFCDWKSKASKRYQISVLIEMAAYVLILLGEKTLLGHHNPVGIELYALAALPTVPIIAVLVAVGIYLRDEKDEYQRDLMVQSLLWGTAGVLSISTFIAFLRVFGWTGSVSPFTEFIAFWILVSVAKTFHRMTNRVPTDE